MGARFTIVNETETTLPRVVFRAIKAETLGEAYELTLIITTSARMRKLNAIYRDIEKPTDILSFPISEHAGEIYLCPAEAKKEAPKFDRTPADFNIFLFIHGCVHLKGYDDGSTMESIEAKLRKKFKV